MKDTKKIKELDTVRIKVDKDNPEKCYGSKDKIKKGSTGAVVGVYGKGKAYEVEFVAKDGRTDAVLTLMPEEIERVEK